ncbi:MAG TPA: DUF393 domain-containing protein [Gemmataceae bacterium]|nr:DUF393 domain-containing protein [Gemmataceae bacterium]
MNGPLLTLYYDGLCPLCSREIAFYRKRVVDNAVVFEDITEPGFDAASRGLDPASIHQVLHVKTAQGDIRTGLEAFIAIWRVIPGFTWLARLAGLPLVHGLMTLGYAVFARFRPWLPRRARNDCAEGRCRV